MEERNYGVTFNEAWIRDVHINLAAVKRRADSLSVRRGVKKEWQVICYKDSFILKSVIEKI